MIFGYFWFEITLLHLFFFCLFLNKMVISQRFKYFFYFSCCRCLNASFGLSSACNNMAFFIILLWYFICVGQKRFNQSKISNYGRHYVKELES